MKIKMNRKRTSGQRTAINAVIRESGAKYVIATGVTVDVADWDIKRERCKTNNDANRRIDEAARQIRQFYDLHGQPPKTLQQTAEKQNPIFPAILQHGQAVVRRNGAPNTMRAYSTLCNNLGRYHEAAKRREKFVEEITENYIEGFLCWLVGQNYADSHTSKMMRTLRTVIRRMIPAERWEGVKPPAPKPAEMVYLTLTEIEKIESLDLKPGSILFRTRDQFLAGYYTGQRYSDWHQVAAGRVWGEKVKMLTINQAKTETKVTIPVREKLREILDRNLTGIPVTSNQRFNKCVKLLARDAGIKQMVSIARYKGRKLVIETVEKWRMVSSHTARRSFATNAYLAGIPVLEIMKFTGHSSMVAFMAYIRITGQETAINYANHPFFTGK